MRRNQLWALEFSAWRRMQKEHFWFEQELELSLVAGCCQVTCVLSEVLEPPNPDEQQTCLIKTMKSQLTHLICCRIKPINYSYHATFVSCILQDFFTLWTTPYVCFVTTDVAGTLATWEPAKGFLFIMFSSSPAWVSIYIIKFSSLWVVLEEMQCSIHLQLRLSRT